MKLNTSRNSTGVLKRKKILAIDTETTGTDFFHGCRPFIISCCDGETNYLYEGKVDPFTRDVHWEGKELVQFIELAESASTIVMHNANFDMRALDSIGIPIDSWYDKLEDTLVASHALCSGDVHGLKDVAVKYLDFWDDDEELLAETVKAAIPVAEKNGWRVAKKGDSKFPGLRAQGTQYWKMDYWLAGDACLQYASNDAMRTFLLWHHMKPALMADNLWDVYQTRKRLLKTAYDIQTLGRSFNVSLAFSLIKSMKEEMEELRQGMKADSGIKYRFDPNNKTHLHDMIHNKLKIPIGNWTKGSTPKPSMDKDTLAQYFKEYEQPALKKLSRYKRVQKKVSDVEGLLNWVDENGSTHSNLNVTGTRETRQSSSAPNDQNTDTELKYLFQPTPGKVWISMDMVNIELRIWAYALNNKDLIEMFETGRSVHQEIMKVIFPEEYEVFLKASKKQESQLTPLDIAALAAYKRVKNGNFAMIYGATDAKINEQYHGRKYGPNYCAKIESKFPGITEFTRSRIRMCEETFRRYGTYSVITMGGYRLDVPPDEPFKACNYYVQGTAGWLMTLSMLAWEKDPEYLRTKSRMTMQQHDSLDTEVSLNVRIQRVIDAKVMCIIRACQTVIPTCDVTWKIIFNPQDKDNPQILELLNKTNQ